MRQDFEMINSSFFVSARPSGDRCLVVAAKGSTTARNSQGYKMFEKAAGGGKFASLLPCGSTAEHLSSKIFGAKYHQKNGCILDCIYDEANMTFHVLDIIQWEGANYQDYPLCSRILFMVEKF